MTHPYQNLWGNPDIHPEAKIGAFVEIGSTPECPTKIGKCKIQARVFIPPGITIEDDVFIGPGVQFANDKYPRTDGAWQCQRTVVKSGAWIGMGAQIGPGLIIEGGVGMGAVVLRNVPWGEIWAGNPAKNIHDRGSKT